MRASMVVVLAILLVLTLGRSGWAADPQETDYSGWQVISTGTEITRASYHARFGYALDDRCTVIKRGTSKYVIKKNPWGKGLESFSMDLVSASTTITVSGGGQAGPPVNTRWSYKLGPSPYRKDTESFDPCNGGAPQTGPDEPMFMPRTVEVSSYVPESEWRPDPPDGPAGSAQEEAVRAWSAAGEGEHPALEFVFPHRLDAQHLTASGHRAFSHDAHPIPEVSASCEIEVSYNVVVIPTQGDHQPPKVELEEVDRSWWPEDSNSMTATVKVTGDKPAKAFRFTLYDVSKEPGKCCNSTDQNADPDLSFAPDAGGWSVEAKGDQWIATSENGGTQASIGIACHDWGAWGKLKAEASIEDKWEPAQVAGSGLGYVRIPYDDDDDHIADSWQALYEVGGKGAKDDSGKRPTDQAKDGDGLSVYECYRGFDVLGEGDQEHAFPDPQQKVLFVLDKSDYFDPGLWEQSSGIKSYLLSDPMCKVVGRPDGARLVNFRSAYARNGDKGCVVITPVKGSYKDADGDFPLGVTTCPTGGCPREVESLYLYPDNMRFWLETLGKQLEAALADPNSPVAQEFEKLGLPHRMWRDAADRLKQGAYVQMLVDQSMRQTAIHEMGHACGLAGHVKDPGNPQSGEGLGLGNKSCPMHYSDRTEDLRYLILQVLLKPDAAMPMTYGQFCRDADFNCWGHLNVKDN